MRADRTIILDVLKKKCAFKGIDAPTMDSLKSKLERAELETEWENMLGHQVTVLPPFEQFWQELPEIFEWLYHAVEKVAAPAMSGMGMSLDETWRPPVMAQAWHTTTPLEIIRYAAANRLCVDLTYQGSRRLIEPYSLRRTREGNLLLYAVKHDTREDRSYRVDRIQVAEVTKVPFTPKYVIELTALGPISAPPTERHSREIGITRPRRTKVTISRARSSTPNYGPKYIFECSLCGKRVTHKSYDSKLNKHKDKHGYPCAGRLGLYITTKY